MSKTHVLLVEDHAMTARGVRMFLELSEFKVTVAVDVQSALKEAATCKFDVLVCDLSLPDGTGWDLMRTLCERSPVRGIAFSAFDEPEHRARSRQAGFLEHIVKGSTPEALLAAVRRAVKRPSTGERHNT